MIYRVSQQSIDKCNVTFSVIWRPIKTTIIANEREFIGFSNMYELFHISFSRLYTPGDKEQYDQPATRIVLVSIFSQLLDSYCFTAFKFGWEQCRSAVRWALSQSSLDSSQVKTGVLISLIKMPRNCRCTIHELFWLRKRLLHPDEG